MDHKQFQDWLSGIDHLSPARPSWPEAAYLGFWENILRTKGRLTTSADVG